MKDHNIPSRSLLTVFLALLLFFSTVIQPTYASDGDDNVTPAGPTAVSKTESIFGVQTYGNTGQDSQYYDLMLETGTTWVRVPFYWDRVEPTENVPPSQYRWSAVDGPVGAAFTSDLKIILTVERAPSWAAVLADGPINEANVKDFVELMVAVVERYDGDGTDDAPGSPVVEYFEFYNEPDGFCNGNRRWGNAGARYANMLKAVYAPMKQANPNAQVVFGGIAYDWFQNVTEAGVCTPVTGWPLSNSGGQFAFNFLDDVLKAGGGDYFDIMNFHTYPSFGKNWTMHCLNREPACMNSEDSKLFDFSGTNQLSLGLYEKTLFVRNKLAQYGYGDKEIVITEAGIGSDVTGFEASGDTPEAIQSEHVVAFFAQAMAADIKALIWWTVFDALPYEMGLVDVDGRKKDAFGVYQVAVEQLASTQFQRVITFETGYPTRVDPSWLGYADLPEYHSEDSFTLEAYRFYDEGKDLTIYVAWLNPLRGEPEKRTLKIFAKGATVKDMYGKTTANLSDTNSDGLVEVAVGGEPIYPLSANRC
jgi:hypothetical protein